MYITSLTHLQDAGEPMADLKAGMQVWIPCEVKPGPFSNERSVRVDILGEPWVAFVDVRFLKDPVTSGRTEIMGRITVIQGNEIVLSLPGHPLDASRQRSIEREEASKVPLVPIPA